jgi:hypothetical protein
MMNARIRTAAALATFSLFAAAAPAYAQSSDCQQAQKILGERQGLIQKLQSMGGKGKKKQLDPRSACTVFTQLVSNGNTGIKWMDANKDWCQVPDNFVQSFKQDHGNAVEMRGKACAAAAKMAQMEKQAREAQKNGGGGNGLLGGGGLTGSYKMPQGAL